MEKGPGRLGMGEGGVCVCFESLVQLQRRRGEEGEGERRRERRR